MAEAGYPLRTETFHYTHRKGGWQLLPFDVADRIRRALPVADPEDWAFLDQHGYVQGGAYRSAIGDRDAVRVDALPEGSWFFDREPVFSVTGPSALVSWLEPLVLQLHFEIQVATAAALGRLPQQMHASTDAERQIVLSAVAAARDLGAEVADPQITVAPEAYYDAVLERAKGLVAIVGDPDRLFEVGMRAASCTEQHEIALRAVRDAGILRTSNVALARRLQMIPVGTMGHEHVQRHGSDRAAYAAMRDRFAGFIFYLPDTFDTLASGIPEALAAIAARPDRNAGIRFDSEHGIEGHYLYAVARSREAGLTPLLGLESGWNDVLTRRFEALREQVGWPADRQGYGYGGYFVRPPWPTFQRDDVAAVWKISRSGDRDTMKFGDEPHGGKSSIPGRPVLWRSLAASGPVGFVAQEGEDWRPDTAAVLLTNADAPAPFDPTTQRDAPAVPSPETRRLVDACIAARDANIVAALTDARRTP